MSDTGGGIHRGTQSQVGGGNPPLDDGKKKTTDTKPPADTGKPPAKPEDDGIHRG
jgi:hypothetical protein